MRFSDAISLSWKYLKNRKLRTILTIVGISISLILITSLIILGDSLKFSTSAAFNKFSPNMITIYPEKSMGVSFTSFFDKNDCDRLKSRFRDIVYCGYLSQVPIFMSQDKTSKMVFVEGVNKDFLDNFDKIGFTLISGRFPTRDNQILLGNLFSKDNGVFPKAYSVGDKIVLNNKRFVVSGVLSSVGDPPDDSAVYLTYDGVSNLLGKAPLISYLMLVTSDNPDKIVDPISQYLKRKKHRSVNVLTTEAMLKKTTGVLDQINYAVLAIALLSLIVGAIGVSNSLFTSVEERKKDIGIMKATGAKDSDIFLMVLTETFIISFISMIVGVLIGYIIAWFGVGMLSNSGFEFILHVNYLSLLEIFCFDIVLALISAYAPARDAAKLNPIEAIRK